MHTVTERGTLERADVLVRNGRIAAVGTGLAAAGATVVEANGRPLTPGLFGGITALGVDEVSLEQSTVDNAPPHGGERRARPREPRPEFDVTLAFNPRLGGDRREPRRGRHLRDGGAERGSGRRRARGPGRGGTARRPRRRVARAEPHAVR